MALQQQMVADGNLLFRYRGVLPLLIIIPALLLRIFLLPDQWMQPHLMLITIIAYLIAFAGLALRFIIVGYAPLRTSGRNTQEQIADCLNSTGMYSVCRHPLYLGNFLMWLGAAILTYNTWFIGLFMLVYWLYYERIMLAEEAYLRGKFGEDYESWADTRPAFIPTFSKWIPYQQPFNFYKALYQEKTGFLWLNLIFWIFTVIPFQQIKNSLSLQNPWTLLLLFSLLLYLILKLTRRKPSTHN